MSYTKSTIVAGALGLISALGILGASSSAEAARVPGSIDGEVWLNAGPRTDGSGNISDCYIPNVTMGGGELKSTGGVTGRDVGAYLFNSPSTLHKSVRVTAYDTLGVKLSSCTKVDNSKDATWSWYSNVGNECIGAIYASVVCYTTTTGT